MLAIIVTIVELEVFTMMITVPIILNMIICVGRVNLASCLIASSASDSIFCFSCSKEMLCTCHLLPANCNMHFAHDCILISLSAAMKTSKHMVSVRAFIRLAFYLKHELSIPCGSVCITCQNAGAAFAPGTDNNNNNTRKQ